MESSRLHIAVVGAGVAGLTAAWLLGRKHRVSLFEKNDYAGGHTRTVQVETGTGAPVPVDTGFVVMNEANYPLLTRLFRQLDVATHDSDMSFSYHCLRTGYQYSGSSARALFGKRRYAFRLDHWRLLLGILRFNRDARRDLEEGRLDGMSLGDYLERSRVNRYVSERYVIPMGSAIWSMPPIGMLNFPAHSFLRFFYNHGLLNVERRVQWKSVVGGSHQYVRRMLGEFDGSVRLNASIEHIRRTARGVRVRHRDGREEVFDRIVIATHADEALGLLADPTPREKELLGTWTYQDNQVVLHTDPAHMPTRRSVWASWNFARESEDEWTRPVSITYHMNRLQRLPAAADFFVSLNRRQPIPEERVLRRLNFTHPVYSFSALATQGRLPELNRDGRTFFCGSYFGYGFHEDAVRSAVEVAGALGVSF
jgi:predicted NAD/FAD-binding protein